MPGQSVCSLCLPKPVEFHRDVKYFTAAPDFKPDIRVRRPPHALHRKQRHSVIRQTPCLHDRRSYRQLSKASSPSARRSAKTDRRSTEGTLHVIMVIPLQFGGGQREILTGAKRAWRRCEQNKHVQFLRAAQRKQPSNPARGRSRRRAISLRWRLSWRIFLFWRTSTWE
jgi:hypothetical protein